jgi:hypothetical protein
MRLRSAGQGSQIMTENDTTISRKLDHVRIVLDDDVPANCLNYCFES